MACNSRRPVISAVVGTTESPVRAFQQILLVTRAIDFIQQVAVVLAKFAADDGALSAVKSQLIAYDVGGGNVPKIVA